MCEQCRYSKMDTIHAVLKSARPDQLQRLLRDIRSTGSNGSGQQGEGDPA